MNWFNKDNKNNENPNRPQRSRTVSALMRRHWLLSAVAVALLAVAVVGAPAWAGPVARPLNQTVPLGTPTPAVDQAVPTATPLPAEPEPSQPSTPSGEQEQEPVDPDSVPFVFPTQPDEAPSDAPAEPGVEPAVLTATVSVNTLNVREGPGTGFPVISTFRLNQQVTVTARNPENTWWYVCCLVNSETPGWVSAPLLQTNFDRAQSAQLIPVFGETTTTGQATAAAQPTPVPATASNGATDVQPISLSVAYTPTFVWQGKTFDIEFTVSNPNDRSLRNLQLSDEVPPGLIYIEARGEGSPEIVERETETGTLIIFRWPTIPADATVQAWITVQVDPDLPPGAVIDNLAGARATNGAYVGSGVMIGLPPAAIPDFQ